MLLTNTEQRPDHVTKENEESKHHRDEGLPTEASIKFPLDRIHSIFKSIHSPVKLVETLVDQIKATIYPDEAPIYFLKPTIHCIEAAIHISREPIDPRMDGNKLRIYRCESLGISADSCRCLHLIDTNSC